MRPVRQFTVAALAAGALNATAPVALRAADLADAPVRPIRIVVPQAAGGSTDEVARMIGERTAARLRVTVFIENKPGAAGLIGSEAVARAAPDGATLLTATANSHAMAPHLLAAVPFDPLADFVPVVNIGYTTKCVVVNSAVPARTMLEFVAYARARPGQLNYSSSGIGSSNHVELEVLARTLAIALVHIPYKGASQSMAALLTGEVHLQLAATPHAAAAAQSGKARVLAVLGSRRSRLMPEVPTAEEAGMGSVDTRTWIGLMAPAGTPAAVVDRYNAAILAVLASVEVREWMEKRGIEIAGGSAASFGATLRADYARWGHIISQLRLRPQ